MRLRDYQKDLIKDGGNVLRRKSSVLLQAGTGLGKTVMATFMVKSAQDRDMTCYFAVHRKLLMDQTAKTFKKVGIDYSYISAKEFYNCYAKTQICTIDTLRTRKEKYPAPDFLFLDECHMAGSKSWKAIVEYYKSKGTKVIGLSATPTRLDGKGLGDIFDEMVCGPPMSWAIENGFLSDYRAFAPSSYDMSEVKKTMGDYNKKDMNNIVMNDRKIVGDAIIHYKKHAAGLRAVAYCTGIDHSKRTAEEFCASGIAAEHIDGTTKPDERRAIIQRYATGQTMVLTNAELITTGFDLASQSGIDVTIDCCIMLRPTHSLSLHLQMIGRVLRPKDYPAILLDHAGNLQAHGLPDDDFDWTLLGREKGKRGDNQENVEKMRRCDICFFGHAPAPYCPNCGYEYPMSSREIEQIEGELVEIERKKQKTVARVEESMCNTLEDWETLAQERGHKTGWAYHRHKNKKNKKQKINNSGLPLIDD